MENQIVAFELNSEYFGEEIASSMDSAFITDITRLDQHLVILLELDQILSTQEQTRLAVT